MIQLVYIFFARLSITFFKVLGFGISSREVVKKVKGSCDGVIIGSAVVRRLNENRKSAIEFIEEIRDELDNK